MPGKSFFTEMREGLHHFYATTLRGEVDDANIRGYLRAATQIEEVWQQIDARRAELSAQGNTPWDAYRQVGTALAFLRAARTYQVFVKELLAADAASDPRTAGYLPQVTYDQANALCHQIQPALQQAIASFHTSGYIPENALPLTLEPRLESEGKPCPLAHLQGMISAAREVREWAAGLMAEYNNEILRAPQVPATIKQHLVALQGHLAQGDSQLRFGVDLVGQITQGEATPELHEEAEDNLWDALQGFFRLNQAIALPELLKRQPSSGISPTAQPHKAYRDRRIRPDDLWQIAAPSARNELRGTQFGTKEMEEMSEKMGGMLSAGAQQYLDEVKSAVARGEAVIVLAMANCPFEPLYRALRPLTLAGAQIRVPLGFSSWAY